MEILKITLAILANLGFSAAIILGFSNWLGKVWANRIMVSEKAKYSKELDEIKHRFQLEQQRLSIVYENQKNSFKRIIDVMYDTTASIVPYDYDQPWETLEHDKFKKFNKVINEESLFIDENAVLALKFLVYILSDAIYYPGEGERPTDNELGKIYMKSNFVSEAIREYFKVKVGLEGEKDPLNDVYMLEACDILNNRFMLSGDIFTQEKVLIMKENETFESFMLNVNNNSSILKKELTRFIEEIEKKEEIGIYKYRYLIKAKKYLKKINWKR